MRLKGLRFTFFSSGTPNGWWPNSIQWNSAQGIYYSEKENLVVINHKNDWREEQDQSIFVQRRKKFPDLHPCTKEELEWLNRQFQHRIEKKERDSNRREFEKKVAGRPAERSQEMTIVKFLGGSRGGGSRDCKITGDSISHYGILLLHRLSSTEYMLGATLSVCGSNNSSVASRVLSVLVRQNNLTLWPSTVSSLTRLAINPDFASYVLAWCTKKMSGVYLRYPCSKYKEDLDLIARNVRDVYTRAVQKWNCQPEQVQMMERFLEFYGDVDKMKGINDAMFMEYQLTQN